MAFDVACVAWSCAAHSSCPLSNKKQSASRALFRGFAVTTSIVNRSAKVQPVCNLMKSHCVANLLTQNPESSRVKASNTSDPIATYKYERCRCIGLRSDLLIRAKVLETRYDARPHCCRLDIAVELTFGTAQRFEFCNISLIGSASIVMN